MSQIVLMHGWGMNQGVWQLVREEIEQSLNQNVEVLDLPGFGLSQNVPKPYTLASAAELIATKLPDNSVLVAWSLAGLFALYIATKHPNKVKRIVLVASSPHFCEQDNWPGIKPEVLSQFMAQLSTDHKKTVERFLAIQAMGSEHARDDVKQLKSILNHYPEPHIDALSGGLEILQREDLRVQFQSVKAPISGIFGRLDSLVPEKVISLLTQLRSDFEHVVINKASHAPFISHPKEFVEALKTCITKV